MADKIKNQLENTGESKFWLEKTYEHRAPDGSAWIVNIKAGPVNHARHDNQAASQFANDAKDFYFDLASKSNEKIREKR